MTIEQRLAKLESELRRWRRAGVCVCVVSAIALTGWIVGSVMKPRTASAADAQAVPTVDELRARHLVIVNDDGKEVIELLAGPLGGGMILRDPQKKTMIALSVAKAEASLQLRDGDGGVDLFGSHISLMQGTDKMRNLAVISAGDGLTSGGNITVFSALGKKVATVQASKTNEGLIGVADVNGKTIKVFAP